MLSRRSQRVPPAPHIGLPQGLTIMRPRSDPPFSVLGVRAVGCEVFFRSGFFGCMVVSERPDRFLLQHQLDPSDPAAGNRVTCDLNSGAA